MNPLGSHLLNRSHRAILSSLKYSTSSSLKSTVSPSPVPLKRTSCRRKYNVRTLPLQTRHAPASAQHLQSYLPPSLYLPNSSHQTSPSRPPLRVHPASLLVVYPATAQQARAMSDDASYGSFLEQANQDTGGASAQSQGGGKQLKTTNASVPKSLRSLDAVYVSDADEQFEGVSLNWEGGELSTGTSCTHSKLFFFYLRLEDNR